MQELLLWIRKNIGNEKFERFVMDGLMSRKLVAWKGNKDKYVNGDFNLYLVTDNHLLHHINYLADAGHEEPDWIWNEMLFDDFYELSELYEQAYFILKKYDKDKDLLVQ